MIAQDATATVSHFEKEYTGKTYLADDHNHLRSPGFSQFVRQICASDQIGNFGKRLSKSTIPI
jgi:hypothetical protein